MAKIEDFPGIKRIALLIAYDGGFINRTCTEEEWLKSLDPVLGAEGVTEKELEVLDVWCMTLTDKEAEDLAYGEENDMEAVAEKCPDEMLPSLFEDIFNA